jgi:hypothetical protein
MRTASISTAMYSWSWWWRQYAPLKRRTTPRRLHGATSQKALIFKHRHPHTTPSNFLWQNKLLSTFNSCSDLLASPQVFAVPVLRWAGRCSQRQDKDSLTRGYSTVNMYAVTQCNCGFLVENPWCTPWFPCEPHGRDIAHFWGVYCDGSGLETGPITGTRQKDMACPVHLTVEEARLREVKLLWQKVMQFAS